MLPLVITWPFWCTLFAGILIERWDRCSCEILARYLYRRKKEGIMLSTIVRDHRFKKREGEKEREKKRKREREKERESVCVVSESSSVFSWVRSWECLRFYKSEEAWIFTALTVLSLDPPRLRPCMPMHRHSARVRVSEIDYFLAINGRLRAKQKILTALDRSWISIPVVLEALQFDMC